MGYLKSTGSAVIYIGLALAVITFIPGLPPEANFSEYSVVSPKDLAPELADNTRLNNAELLYQGELRGAESFDSYNGELYSGVHGGYIVKLTDGRIVPIVKFGTKCDEVWQESQCGRPLGLKFDKKGDLYVNDAYYGIFVVNVRTKEYRNIVDMSKPIGGTPPHLVNSLDVASNGDIYWTDSSTEFGLDNGIYTFLANPAGRLIRYNAATNKNEVLLGDLGFANGIKLSDDESFVIVAESLTSRVIKYHLKGAKKGQSETFLLGLPGVPDNIHTDGQGGYLITLIVQADSQHPLIFQSTAPHPYIRKMFARILGLTQAFCQLMHNIYPNHYAEQLIYSIGSFQSWTFLDPKKITVLRVTATGEIIDAACSTDGKIQRISSAFVHKDYLWLGSPSAEYVARVPLERAFPHLIQKGKDTKDTQKRIEVPHTKSGVPPVQVEKPVKLPNVETPTQSTAPPLDKPVAPKSASMKSTTPEKDRASSTLPAPNTVSRKESKIVSTTERSTVSTTESIPSKMRDTGSSATTSKPSVTTSKPSTTTSKPSTTTSKPSTTVKPSAETVPKTMTDTGKPAQASVKIKEKVTEKSEPQMKTNNSNEGSSKTASSQSSTTSTDKAMKPTNVNTKKEEPIKDAKKASETVPSKSNQAVDPEKQRTTAKV